MSTALLSLLALMSAVPATAASMDRPGNVVSERVHFRGRDVLAARGEVLVAFPAGVGPDAQRACAQRHGLRLVHSSPYLPVALFAVPAGVDLAETAVRVASDPGVLDARPNAITRASDFDPTAAPLLAYQSGLALHDVPAAWQTATGLGASVKVAVLDTGVSPVPSLPRLEAGFNALGGPDARDDNGHGTHMASIIASQGALSGVAPMATILPVKVLDQDKLGTELALVEGLYYAATVPGVRVISMSLTFPPGYLPSRMLTEAVASVAREGIVMVAASGNDGAARVGYPARLPAVISVGAVRMNTGPDDLELASYSNGSVGVDLLALGGDLARDADDDGVPDGIAGESVPTAAAPAGIFLTMGTSPAAAQVAGAVALLLDSGVPASEVLYRLQYNSEGAPAGATALEGGASGRGLLNADQALPGRERAGFQTADANRPLFVNQAPVFMEDKGERSVSVVFELTDAAGKGYFGADLIVELGGDAAETRVLSCPAGFCIFQSAPLPADAELVTLTVLGALDESDRTIRRPYAASRFDRLSYEFLANLGAGLGARGVIFRYSDGLWTSMNPFAWLTSQKEEPTWVMRPLGLASANLPTVLVMRETALQKHGLLESTLVLETEGAGLAMSALTVDRAFFAPGRQGEWKTESLLVRHVVAGSGLEQSAIDAPDGDWSLNHYFGGGDPGVLVMSQGTGLASSALVWDLPMLDSAMMVGPSTAPWSEVPPGSGGAGSGILSEYGPTAVTELGGDWEATDAAFPGGAATLDQALAQQLSPVFFAEEMMNLPPGQGTTAILGTQTEAFSPGCVEPGAACGICGYVAEEACDGLDNDCDGETDEGVANPCGGCGPAPVEVCNGVDDDCDGQTDEGVMNVCGGCGAVPAESCDGLDNDCDGLTDEGLTNACGGCGPVPEESCNLLDDDCDGQTDEGVTNACGQCGAVPEEVCDGIDNNCDGQTDEGLLNACGGCGPVGEEVCDGFDNDCDGAVDEGVTNACGSCGELGAEVCDGFDNDCDGETDEELLNACGGCGEVAAEVCDGVDNDCDGETDERVLNACGGCGPVDAEVCNGLDDDCDGAVDDGVLNACGGCGPTPAELCDGLDNDCDGAVDEGFDVGVVCMTKVGSCHLAGVRACHSTGRVAQCVFTVEVPSMCLDGDEPEPVGPDQPKNPSDPNAPAVSAAQTKETGVSSQASISSGCAGGGGSEAPVGLALVLLAAAALGARRRKTAGPA